MSAQFTFCRRYDGKSFRTRQPTTGKLLSPIRQCVRSYVNRWKSVRISCNRLNRDGYRRVPDPPPYRLCDPSPLGVYSLAPGRRSLIIGPCSLLSPAVFSRLTVYKNRSQIGLRPIHTLYWGSVLLVIKGTASPRRWRGTEKIFLICKSQEVSN